MPTAHLRTSAARASSSSLAASITRLAQALLLAVCAASLSAPVRAGQNCNDARPSPQTVARSMELAQQTAQALEADYRQRGTRVVLLARAGQDLSRYGQTWSHVGWAYRSSQGPWRVVHKLNQCGTDQAMLMRQGLGEFFLDDLWRYQAVWSAAPQPLADALWRLLQDNRRATALHQRRYNMLSYTWGTRYQQSNQWALETLALAAEPAVGTREQAQAWLRFKGYQPSVLKIRALTRLGANATRANIAFDDHPNAQRFSNRIETTTADSILQWLPHSLQFSAPQYIHQ